MRVTHLLTIAELYLCALLAKKCSSIHGLSDGAIKVVLASVVYFRALITVVDCRLLQVKALGCCQFCHLQLSLTLCLLLLANERE